MNVADGTVLLDCKDLTYISSPGLRLFLTLRKASIAKGGTAFCQKPQQRRPSGVYDNWLLKYV